MPLFTRALMPRSRQSTKLFGGLVALLVVWNAQPASAQSCYGLQSYGGASTVNLVTAVPAVGSSPSNMNALENDGADGSYYQLSTFAGPASVTVATALVSGSIADNDKAPLGLTFINGGANAVKIRRVTVESDRTKLPLFRTSPKPTNIDPLTGVWNVSADDSDAVWSAPAGGFTVAAKDAQGFLANIFVSNVGSNINNDLVGGTITTCANLCDGSDDLTVYVAQAYPTDLYVPNSSQKVATAVIGFVDGGAFPSTTTKATYGPPANLVGGQPGTIVLRAKEWSGNQAIASGLQLTLTLPPQWTNVSVASAGAPWDLTTAVVTGSSAAGWTVTISTNAVIQKGNSTGNVVVSATPPVVYTKSTFQSKASLSGNDTSTVPAGGHPIRSVCDGGGTILPVSGGGSSPALNVEFLSAPLNAGASRAPVEQVDFRADFNLVNNAAPVSVNVEAYNFTTSSWQALTGSPVTPGSADVTIAQTFSGSTLFDFVDDQQRMRIRFASGAGGPQTLRIDYMTWSAQTYWVVDNTPGAGSDSWPAGTKFAGSTKYPFASLAAGSARVSGGEKVRVMTGASRSGTPYAGDVSLGGAAVAGTAVCRTWFEGVANAAGQPLVRGASPSADWGFDVAADYVKVSGFCFENMLAALLAENPSNGIVFDGNTIRVPSSAYGIVLNNYATAFTTPSNGLQATNNTIDGTGAQPFFGIFDAGARSSLIDGNDIIAIPNFGMYFDSATSPLVQRNVVTGGYFGIYIARTTGATLNDNTVDMNSYRGIFAEGSTGIVSRNNIVSRSIVGVSTDTPNSIDSDYDDVWSNATNYSGLSAGANSISANPLWIQTTDPALATWYRLNSGSPAIDRGINVGLPFLGAAPDLGAVESQ